MTVTTVWGRVRHPKHGHLSIGVQEIPFEASSLFPTSLLPLQAPSKPPFDPSSFPRLRSPCEASSRGPAAAVEPCNVFEGVSKVSGVFPGVSLGTLGVWCRKNTTNSGARRAVQLQQAGTAWWPQIHRFAPDHPSRASGLLWGHLVRARANFGWSTSRQQVEIWT